MSLTDAELAYVRSEVGDDVPEDDLYEASDRLATPVDVVLEVLRKRLATVLAAPVGFSIPGVYSQDSTPAAVVQGLQAQLQRVAQDAGLTGTTATSLPLLQVAKLTARRPRR